jgi:hypothetical protein
MTREHLREYDCGDPKIQELEGDQGRDGLRISKKICKYRNITLEKPM